MAFWGAAIAGGGKLLGMAAGAIGIGGVVTGIVNADQKFFGGHITGFVGSAIEGVTRVLGKHQQTAIKDVELFTFGKHMDNWGKGLASILENTPFKFISDWLRNTGQDMMGVNPAERQFGTATQSYNDPRAAGMMTATTPRAADAAPTVTPSAPSVTNTSWRVPDTNARVHTAFADVAPNIDQNTLRASYVRQSYFTAAPANGGLNVAAHQPTHQPTALSLEA